MKRVLIAALLLASCSPTTNNDVDALKRRVDEQQKLIEQVVAAQADQTKINANFIRSLQANHDSIENLKNAGCSQLRINDKLLGTHLAVC